jgi:uncharacterized protein (TIGR00730 family)
MPKFKTICVYCGSRIGKNPEFARSAAILGKFFAQNNIQLIYGGGNIGLMNEVSKATLAHGGNVTGIIPRHLYDLENKKNKNTQIKNPLDKNMGLTKLIITETMHERKQIMFEKSCAFITLPGSVGTLDETLEMITWRQLKRHDKPIFILNEQEFWQPLFQLIDHLIDQKFSIAATKKLYQKCDTIEGLLNHLT